MEDNKGRIMNRQSAASDGVARAKASGRRGFLAGAGAAGVAGAAVLASRGAGTPALAEAADPVAPTKTAAGRGYHETDHIRKYYDTTKV